MVSDMMVNDMLVSQMMASDMMINVMIICDIGMQKLIWAFKKSYDKTHHCKSYDIE
jgi:hypothetical protein